MATNPRIKPIENATGRSWDEWMKFMDEIGAKDLDHTAIAAKVFQHLDGKIDSPGWWAQGVTVTYEQVVGRRLPGQRSDGTFQTSISKATDLSMHSLMEKWTSFAARDKAVLDLITDGVRESGSEKRLNWRTKAKDEVSILVTSEPKQNDSAALVITLTNLASPELSEQARTRWLEVLNRFILTI